eukprot:SAG31_NODE_2964_length_4844_cov_1.789673_4_plen_683_part_00
MPQADLRQETVSIVKQMQDLSELVPEEDSLRDASISELEGKLRVLDLAQTDLDKSAGRRAVRISTANDEVQLISPRLPAEREESIDEAVEIDEDFDFDFTSEMADAQSGAVDPIAPELLPPAQQLSPDRREAQKSAIRAAQEEWDKVPQSEPWELVAGRTLRSGRALDLSLPGPNVRVSQTFTVDQMRDMRETALSAPASNQVENVKHDLDIAISSEECSTDDLRSIGVEIKDTEPFESAPNHVARYPASVETTEAAGLPAPLPAAAVTELTISVADAVEPEDLHSLGMDHIEPFGTPPFSKDAPVAASTFPVFQSESDGPIREAKPPIPPDAGLRYPSDEDDDGVVIEDADNELQTLASKDAEINALKAELASYTASAATATNPTELPEVKLLLAQAALPHIEAKNAAERECEAAAERLTAQSVELQDALHRAEEAEKRAAAATAKAAAAESRMAELSTQLAESRSKFVPADVEALQEQLHEMTERYEDAAEKAANRDEQLDEANGQIGELEDAIADLKVALVAADKQKDLEQATSQVSNLELKITKLEEALVVAEAKAATVPSHETMEKLQRELDHMTERYENSAKDSASRDAKLDEACAEVSSLQTKAATLEAALEATKLAKPDITNEIEMHKSTAPRELGTAISNTKADSSAQASALLATAKELRERQLRILRLFSTP